MTVAAARLAWSDVLRATPVVAVLRAPKGASYAPVVDALTRGGLRSIELTMTTPGTIAALPALKAQVPLGVEIGVGTVLSVDEADAAIDAGADYLVTPNTDARVITRARDRGIAIYPGGLTPTELRLAWSFGVSAVKLFPAAAVGPEYLHHLHGPFPDLRVIPSGGIAVDAALDWLGAGAAAVSVGGPLLRDAFAGGDLDALTTRTRALLTRVLDRVGS